MSRQILRTDIQDALDAFVQAGLICEFPMHTGEFDEKRERALIKKIIKRFCPRFTPDATILQCGHQKSMFRHFAAGRLESLGIVPTLSARMPDLVVHDFKRNWLLLIEAVTSAGPVDGKRRKELKELFAGCTAGLVFVTAFETRRAMQSFVSQIAWESEVWIAEDPDHMIHFNGERFLGPYPDVLPK